MTYIKKLVAIIPPVGSARREREISKMQMDLYDL